MQEPDNQHGSGIQQTLCGTRHGHCRWRSSGPEPGQLLRLKLDVKELVAQDLVAEPAEYRRLCCLAQGRVVDLGDDLGGDQHADGNLEAGDQVAQPPEDAVGERRLEERDAVERQETPEVARVALLFGNEQPDGQQVVRVTAPPRVVASEVNQVAAFGSLPGLKFLQRPGDGRELGGCRVRSRLPGDVEQRARVPLIVQAPAERV